MSKTILNPAGLSQPTGFANGVLTQGGKLLFLAGQTGTDGSGRIGNPFDLIAQFEQSLENIKRILESAGGVPTDIVKLTVYVTDQHAYFVQRARIGQVFRSFFGAHTPALTLLEVKSLQDRNALIEIDGTAVIAD